MHCWSKHFRGTIWKLSSHAVGCCCCCFFSLCKIAKASAQKNTNFFTFRSLRVTWFDPRLVAECRDVNSVNHSVNHPTDGDDELELWNTGQSRRPGRRLQKRPAHTTFGNTLNVASENHLFTPGADARRHQGSRKRFCFASVERKLEFVPNFSFILQHHVVYSCKNIEIKTVFFWLCSLSFISIT